jgi:DNA-binding MarR family transcriptional regulator
MTRHPANELDDTVHQRVRLGILTIAHEARRVEFTYLRNNLELTAGNLSQHLGVLENAGLITIEKGFAGKRARTWVTLTSAGETALAEEIAQLKLLISQIETAGSSAGASPDEPDGRRPTGSAHTFTQGAECFP